MYMYSLISVLVCIGAKQLFENNCTSSDHRKIKLLVQTAIILSSSYESDLKKV